jgi:hypothetical protein
MKFYKIKVCFPYLIVFVLIVFGSFTGCGHVKLLEYDDEETYTDMDKGFLAPSTPSDINKALNILLTTNTNKTDNVRWAVSIIVKPIDNSTIDISDINKTFSIDEFVESDDKTLRKEKWILEKDALKRIVIQALNVSIEEVSKHPEHRLEPSRAVFFALGERLAQNGIMKISENMANQKLLDTSSSIILSIVINRAVSLSIADPIAKKVMGNNIPFDELVNMQLNELVDSGFFSLGFGN